MFIIFVGKNSTVRRNSKPYEQKILPRGALRVPQQRKNLVIFVRGIRW